MVIILVLPMTVAMLFYSLGSSDISQQDKFNKWSGVDFHTALNCGYIDIAVGKSIFNPAFLKLLVEEERWTPFAAFETENFVDIYNSMVTSPTRRIWFDKHHFRQIARLSSDDVTQDSVDEIDMSDIRILYSWYQLPEMNLNASCILQKFSPSELAKLNPENDKLLNKSFEKVASDPVGNILIGNAIKRGVSIYSRSIHGPAAVSILKDRHIIVDKTVNTYVFKIRFLVHELVHMANHSKQNSITEETLAEVISMGVQDRITGVDMACSPYVVFVDRVTDSYYGKLPLDNGIKKHLRTIGIDADSGRVATCH